MESLEYKLGRVKYQHDHRGSLYFDQWAYSVSWRQPEIAALRFGLNHDYVEQVILRRKQWENARWGHAHFPNEVGPISLSRVTDQVVGRVHQVREWLINAEWPLKTVFYHSQIIVYTQCQAAVDAAVELALEITPGTVTVKQAQVTQDPNKVYFKGHHDYSYRTYFRSRDLSTQTIDRLNQWVANMGSAVKVCPSLSSFLLGFWRRSNWTYDHYFVDHNDPKLEVWLAMMAPGLVRKTMPIVSAAK